MTFVILNNMKNVLKYSTNGLASTFKDIEGTDRILYQLGNSVTVYNPVPFYCITNQSSPWTASDKIKILAYASGDTNISTYVTQGTDYAPHTTIGSCSCQATALADNIGWSMAITVTGTEGDVIKSFYFSRNLQYTSSSASNAEACVFAIELDNPVTIDSTGKAYFTFSVKYD